MEGLSDGSCKLLTSSIDKLHNHSIFRGVANTGLRGLEPPPLEVFSPQKNLATNWPGLGPLSVSLLLLYLDLLYSSFKTKN